MKVACITEQVLTLVNKRIGLYRHFDETINRYKQSRDVSTLNSGKKSLETEHKALTSEIALLQSRLKTEGSDLCDKVSVCHARVPRLCALLSHLQGLSPACPSTAGPLRGERTPGSSCSPLACPAGSLGVSVVRWARKLCQPPRPRPSTRPVLRAPASSGDQTGRGSRPLVCAEKNLDLESCV